MRFEQCPRCAKQGKDTSKDNLAVYDDGHSYCYGCQYFQPAPKSIANMARKIRREQSWSAGEQSSLDLDGCTYALPKEPLAWLRRYGITDEEIHKNGICWNETSNCLVFPILDNLRVVATASRNFSGQGPKYITKGNTKQFYKVFTNPTDIYVLVEDFVSAIKVGRHYNCCPLLGAHVPLSLILSLAWRKPRLRIWLDPDKRIEAMKFTQRALQYIPDVATIVADKDPKDYNNKEITEIVSGTFESPA